MPQKPKKLIKGNDKMLFGVCSGIGEYVGVDPTVIRLLWIVATAFTGFVLGGIAYLVASIVIPDK